MQCSKIYDLVVFTKCKTDYFAGGSDQYSSTAVLVFVSGQSMSDKVLYPEILTEVKLQEIFSLKVRHI